MAKVCELTGKGPVSGNRVSHANNKTRRRFLPNLQKKRIYLPEQDAWVEIKLSTSVLRTIDKKGLDAVLRDAAAKGLIVY